MEITVDHPHLPPGMELGISGLTTVPNGETVELEDIDVEMFEADRGMSIYEAFAGDAIVKIDDGSKQEEAFEKLQSPEEQEKRKAAFDEAQGERQAEQGLFGRRGGSSETDDEERGGDE